MNNNILFKKLVDVLYFLHFAGLIVIIFILPFGLANINQLDSNVEDWSTFLWVVGIIILLTYIVFLRGLYYLRNIAGSLLSNNYFSELIITNLKKSGIHFLLTGVFSLLILILFWINKLYEGKLEFGYDVNLMIPLFLMIIGMFFIIQSNTLFVAKNIKEENDLTV